MKTGAMVGMCVCAGTVCAADSRAAALVALPEAVTVEKRVDNPVDAWLTAHSGPAGKGVGGDYNRRFEILDTTDFKQGDFAVTFEVTNPETQTAFGFFPGEYMDHWGLAGDFSVQLWLKAKAETDADAWELAIYDTAGARLAASLEGMAVSGEWMHFDIALQAMTGADGFNFGQVKAVQVEACLARGARLWLDDVHFSNGAQVLGISDKTITQYMREAAVTRQRRVEQTLAGWPIHAAQSFYFVPLLYKGDNLEALNASILAYIETEAKGGKTWSLWTSSTLQWMYFGFSSEGRIKPGRLSAEVEKALLDFMWARTEHKNDIATTRRSTWYTAGSENHNINMRHANLLSSQIFKNLPDYKDRIYPNLGRMIGYKYGMNSEFLPPDTVAQFKLGSGNFSDGKEYKPADHYQAWVASWKEYIAERARYGFFSENNASGYMSHTLRFLHDIYAWCDDAELRAQTRMFLDLIWAKWMQDQLLLIQGGATVRGAPGDGRMGQMAVFFMGGPAAQTPGDFFCLSNYEWPRQLWEIILDRQGKGEFAFVSRDINEEQDIDPRPAGTEYSMLVRPDSRLVRYSWVTPEYVMGIRMEHPKAHYIHTSPSIQGITFPTTPGATISFGAGFTRAVQDRNVVVMTPKTSHEIIRLHPPWFPGNRQSSPNLLTIAFGPDVDQIIEKDGWIFAQEGNAYVAFRIAQAAALTPVDFDQDGFGLLALADKPYAWKEKTVVAETEATALIVEASSTRQYATFEQFQDAILANELKLKLVIHGYLLTYKGGGDEAKEIYLNCANNETPKIDGQYITYAPPAFHSSYLHGNSGGGVVTIQGAPGGKTLELDFNTISRREIPGL